jgi:glycosyltransferase involved in cell wall biosynthesis
MTISLITVSYNAAATIKDTIESVITQSHPDIEYIIVDGNSKDKTIEIVRSFGGRISKFISEPDKGIYDAMNKGLKMATGEVNVYRATRTWDLFNDQNILLKRIHKKQFFKNIF